MKVSVEEVKRRFSEIYKTKERMTLNAVIEHFPRSRSKYTQKYCKLYFDGIEHGQVVLFGKIAEMMRKGINTKSEEEIFRRSQELHDLSRKVSIHVINKAFPQVKNKAYKDKLVNYYNKSLWDGLDIAIDIYEFVEHNNLWDYLNKNSYTEQ